MSVVDISKGGTNLDVSANYRGDTQEIPLLAVGNNLRDIELSVPLEEESVKVHIKEVLVKRLAKNPVTSRYNCALQFIALKNDSKKILHELIYRIQRDTLRRNTTIK